MSDIKLVVAPPLKPMLAKKVDRLPDEGDWLFEPKWDGFRTILFRDGDDWMLQSRDLKPLRRYFPELGEPILGQLPDRVVLDGELVIARAGRLEFESLQMRLHPAASRVNKLAAEIPASLVVWDLLCLGDEDLLGMPFAERRSRLESTLRGVEPPLHVTPITRDRAVAADWFERFEGAGFDGVMAKKPDGIYQPAKRSMLKVKHKRTVDCVVGGFRWHKNSSEDDLLVGSLLLGLYDEQGVLHHIGVAASFADKRRRELVELLAPYRAAALDGHPWGSWAAQQGEASHRRPGSTSRWNAGKSLAWEPLRPELVVEVSYDHMQGSRFRHTAHFARWRPDKAPGACSYEQVDETPPIELEKIFS